jgi:hypothetical protein
MDRPHNTLSITADRGDHVRLTDIGGGVSVTGTNFPGTGFGTGSDKLDVNVTLSGDNTFDYVGPAGGYGGDRNFRVHLQGDNNKANFSLPGDVNVNMSVVVFDDSGSFNNRVVADIGTVKAYDDDNIHVPNLTFTAALNGRNDDFSATVHGDVLGGNGRSAPVSASLLLQAFLSGNDESCTAKMLGDVRTYMGSFTRSPGSLEFDTIESGSRDKVEFTGFGNIYGGGKLIVNASLQGSQDYLTTTLGGNGTVQDGPVTINGALKGSDDTWTANVYDLRQGSNQAGSVDFNALLNGSHDRFFANVWGNLSSRTRLGIHGNAKGWQDTMAVKAGAGSYDGTTVDYGSRLFLDLVASGTADTVTADMLLNLHGNLEIKEQLGDGLEPPPSKTKLHWQDPWAVDQGRINIITREGSDGHVSASIYETQSSVASNLDLEIRDLGHTHLDYGRLDGNGTSKAKATRNVFVHGCQDPVDFV